MPELNNIQQINTIREILKNVNHYLTTSFIGCKFLVFELSHRKAINLLLKNGFSLCNNPFYIQKEEIFINKKAVSYSWVFMCRIGLEDFNILKEQGVKDLSKQEEELKHEIAVTQ